MQKHLACIAEALALTFNKFVFPVGACSVTESVYHPLAWMLPVQGTGMAYTRAFPAATDIVTS